MSDPTGIDLEPGSFRDPTSRVLRQDGRVLRVLSGEALEDWHALKASSTFERFAGDGLVATTEVETPDVRLLAAVDGDWAGVLEHEPIPFVSYPYEWTFSMLRDAAALQLALLRSALPEDLVLKDATPFNVQWQGARPVFIDVGSFERYRAGEPWVGYAQFCQQFLYPLMLRAYKDVAFQPWLRGRLAGIDPQELRKLMTRADLLRPGVLLHVVLQARLARRYAGGDRGMRDEMKQAGFRREMIEANVARLSKLVGRLEWGAASSEWSSYAAECAHVSEDREPKSAFVREVLADVRPSLVWDVGANDGHFSELAASAGSYVVAMDADELVVDRLYQRLRSSGQDRVLPLVVDLADPSPNLGWAGAERRDLPGRGRPDLVLCLAVLHHLAISGNVPVARVLDWLAGLDAAVVLEFATPEDPMVRRLVRNKRASDVHPDYDEQRLRALMAERFEIRRETALPSGHRTLFALAPHP